MLSTRYGVLWIYAAPQILTQFERLRFAPAILVGMTPSVTGAKTASFAGASAAWLCVTGGTSAQAPLPLKHTVYVITDSCQQHGLSADCFAPTG